MINYIKNKFSLRFRQENELLKENILRVLSKNALWTYTIPKSGTTYLLFILGNLLNQRLDKEKRFRIVDFSILNNFFAVHSAIHTIKHKNGIDYIFNKKLTITENYPFESILSTHIKLDNNLWKYCIFQYRNPLDYLISCYHYFHLSRGDNKFNHPFLVREKWINRYIKEYNNFIKISNEFNHKCISIAYEDLVRSPEQSINKILNFTNLEFSNIEVKNAIELSSKKNIKKIEKINNGTIVAQKNKNFKFSFVRSGEIGEWKSVFDSNQVEIILNMIRDGGIDPDKFIYH